ncbi:MAG: hypothetical protein U5L45_23070 [Saprospiraceae bacterium]|nr:hypothetical protein [Saprospiraceae bacterium]
MLKRLFLMKLLLSISLLIIMMASVTVTTLVQWQGEDVCELKESKESDADDEFKIGKEKEVYTINSLISMLFSDAQSEKTKEKLYYLHECLVSENHSFLPKIPPEA